MLTGAFYSNHAGLQCRHGSTPDNVMFIDYERNCCPLLFMSQARPALLAIDNMGVSLRVVWACGRHTFEVFTRVPSSKYSAVVLNDLNNKQLVVHKLSRHPSMPGGTHQQKQRRLQLHR
jgi:hypothetical protein